MTFLILFISLVLFLQSLFSVYLMLYSWEHPDKLEASQGPKTFLPPHHSFTVLLPARHEEAVIYDTIKRVWATNYPSKLLEVVVICHYDDTGTVAEAQRAIRDIGTERIWVETFSDGPINKPHGLNVGFRNTTHEIVTIFDAEDDIDADIFNVVNTIVLQEKVGIVQAGVQLMNFRDHWFSVHNCMEYFFWFKSRLHFHSKVGMIPLGGNTVFIRRDLMQRVGGWDEHCLTEDAEIGLRLSALGEPIRVVYDRKHVTREETPPNVDSFIRQRTRWQQGFIQVLFKGTWLKLPRFSQRILAFYTLSYPFQQAIITLLWIPAVLAVLWLRLPISIALPSFLPLYSLLFQFLTTVVGAYVFTRDYRLKFPLHLPLTMAITFLPFHWLLGISAIRAAYRELFRRRDWEKTAHVGAHRQQTQIATVPQTELPQSANLDQILKKREAAVQNLSRTEIRELVAITHEGTTTPSTRSIDNGLYKKPLDSALEQTPPLSIHQARQIEALITIDDNNSSTTLPINLQKTQKQQIATDTQSETTRLIEKHETLQLPVQQDNTIDQLEEQAIKEHPIRQEQEEPSQESAEQSSQSQDILYEQEPTLETEGETPLEQENSNLDEEPNQLPAIQKATIEIERQPTGGDVVLSSMSPSVVHIKRPKPEKPMDKTTTTLVRKRTEKQPIKKDWSGAK